MPSSPARGANLKTDSTPGTLMRFRDKSRGSRRFRYKMGLKRFIDVTGSLVLMLVLSPLIIISAILVAVTSQGDIIFAQKRWGLNERQFVCYKLRSMFVNRQLAELLPERETVSGELVKLQNDPRVTRVGWLIRKCSIDELPQLFNVLLGDMSLVGPRPLVIHMMEPYPDIREWRCLVRPGITGLWQLRNRDKNTNVLEMVQDDIEYVENLGLLLDLKILLATLPAVLRARGAH